MFAVWSLQKWVKASKLWGRIKDGDSNNTDDQSHSSDNTSKEATDPMWILCDNKSTVDIVNNSRMITGIGGEPTKILQEEDLLEYETVGASWNPYFGLSTTLGRSH